MKRWFRVSLVGWRVCLESNNYVYPSPSPAVITLSGCENRIIHLYKYTHIQFPYCTNLCSSYCIAFCNILNSFHAEHVPTRRSMFQNVLVFTEKPQSCLEIQNVSTLILCFWAKPSEEIPNLRNTRNPSQMVEKLLIERILVSR